MATWNDPRSASQEAGRLVFGTSSFGGGENQANLAKATPEQLQRYNALTASLQSKYAPSTYEKGGVETVGQIEPFNAYQKNALTMMGQPNTAGSQFFNAAGDAATRAAQPFDPSQFNALQAGFMNPYQQQVINSTVGAINEQAGLAKNALSGNFADRANRGGALSFGDSAQAIQLSQLEKNRLNTIGNQTANLNQQGWNASTTNALNTMQNNAGNALSASAALTGVGNTFRGNQQQDIQGMLSAGDRIQGQNQNALTASYSEYLRKQGYPQQQLNALTGYLNAFPSSTTQDPYKPNWMQQLGGLGVAAGGLMGSGGFGGSSGGAGVTYDGLPGLAGGGGWMGVR